MIPNGRNIIILGLNGIESIKGTVSKMTTNNIHVFSKNKKNVWRKLKKSVRNNGSLVFANINDDSELIIRSEDKVIKWGNSIPMISHGKATYNKPRCVNLASNKAEFRRHMYEEGLPVPKHVVEINDSNNKYPIIVRPEKHHAGEHFYIATNKEQLSSFIKKLGGIHHCYASELYPKSREWRVHCAHGKILAIKEKPKPRDINEIAWNFALNEDAWETIDRKGYDKEICTLALESVAKCGLDFGAVDIMFNPIEKGYPNIVLCEINTSPSLTEYLQEKYALYFDYLFRVNDERPHWTFNKFEKGKSLSWKNFQLKELKE